MVGDVEVRREHAVVAGLLRLAPVVRLTLLVLLARDDGELLALLLRRELDPARPRDDAGVDLPLVLRPFETSIESRALLV